MSKFFACQDAQCKSEHAYCYTCFKEVCERGEADLHRSIGHEVQAGSSAGSVISSSGMDQTRYLMLHEPRLKAAPRR